MSGSCVTLLSENTGEKIYTRWRCHRPLCSPVSPVFADRGGSEGRIDVGSHCAALTRATQQCVQMIYIHTHTHTHVSPLTFFLTDEPLQCVHIHTLNFTSHSHTLIHN